MASPVRNLIVGAVVAVAIATAMVVPNIGGVSTWKVLLGAFGVILFVLAGLSD